MSRPARLRYRSVAALPVAVRSKAGKALRSAPTAPRKKSEHDEAVELMELVLAREPDCPELELFYAVPNGGDRHAATAGKMKDEGVRPGVPDYALPVPRGVYHGLYIELKSLTGSPSREQRRWIQRLREHGCRAEVARGALEAWAILCDYLGIEP